MIGTETSVTDIYATRLFARLYGTLAASRNPDVIEALADARREVQAELATSPDRRDNQLGGLGEWAVGGDGPGRRSGGGRPGSERRPGGPAGAGAAAHRGAGCPAAHGISWGAGPSSATGPPSWPGKGLSGIVVCGIGGTGKTTLAAEITARHPRPASRAGSWSAWPGR